MSQPNQQYEQWVAEVSYKDGYELSVFTGHDGHQQVILKVRRTDSVTGEIGYGYSRSRMLPLQMVKSEFVRLVFGIILGYEEHETREFFRLRGRQVFGPHIDVEALWDVAERVEFAG